MKTFFSLLCLLLISAGAYATTQNPEKIIIDGKTYDLLSCPLELYFEKYPEKRPLHMITTGTMRGYIATFEIIEKELFLKNMEIYTFGDHDLIYTSILNEVFPGEQKIPMSWFSGRLVVPIGERLSPGEFVWPVYKKYWSLRFKNGKYKGKKIISNKQFQYRYPKYKPYREPESTRKKG